MIKGINREMIEVTHTGSPYFERAFLVVRHGSTRPPDEVLHTIAQRVVEQAETFELFDHPSHPYTRGLMNAVASLEGESTRLDTIPGVVPNLLHLPEGCSFSPRCERCCEACRQSMPELAELAPGHFVRCIKTMEG